MDGNVAHSFQKVVWAEERPLEIKNGMLIGNKNRQQASLKWGAIHPVTMHLLNADFMAAVIYQSDH